MNRIKMKKVIGGKKYDTETATLIADDVYWDGNNFERHGRNTWLYRTPRGAFFRVDGTFWQGERDVLVPVSESEAKRIYEEDLPEHYLEWEDAFGEVPDEPEPERGRPPIYGEPMKLISVQLPVEQVEWLKQRNRNETIRNLIAQAMTHANPNDPQA
jgi:hypothetical protein